jgi:hypothetical protein
MTLCFFPLPSFDEILLIYEKSSSSLLLPSASHTLIWASAFIGGKTSLLLFVFVEGGGELGLRFA